MQQGIEADGAWSGKLVGAGGDWRELVMYNRQGEKRRD